jgi:hypothetical protein
LKITLDRPDEHGYIVTYWTETEILTNKETTMEVDRERLEEILRCLSEDLPRTAKFHMYQILSENHKEPEPKVNKVPIQEDFDGYDSALCIDTAVKSILYKHPVSKSTCYEWIKLYFCLYSTILVIKIQCKDILKEVLNAK